VFTSAELERPADLENDTGSQLQASWSPDGKEVAFVATVTGLDAADVYLLDLESGDSARIYEGEPGTLLGPMKWSPNGRHIATRSSTRVESTEHLLLIDTDSGHASKPTESLGNVGGIEQYAWSPDSSQVAFTRNELQPPNPSLYVARADGSATRRIGEAWGGTSPAWSPDGDWIAVSQVRGEFTQVSLVRSDGSEMREIASELKKTDQPAWSPNGKNLAFLGSPSADFNDRRLYVTDIDQPELGEISGPQVLAFYPIIVWSGDGDRVLFTADAGACQEGCPPGYLFMVDASGDDLPTKLHDHEVYSVLGWRP
jgi:Tol biopolymer transport system component